MDDNSTREGAIADCDMRQDNGVSDTLQKIRAATYRLGFNLWNIFGGMEPPGKRFIAVHKFLTVLGGPLKDIIGLGEKELRNLAAYFKVNDSRIDFDRFCRMIHPEIQRDDSDGNMNENMFISNKLGVAEENRLLIILTKIATICGDLHQLKAQFETCELQHKNNGLVFRGSFFRVLNYFQLQMSPFEQGLIFDKYKRDSLSMKYLAFLSDVSRIQKILKKQAETFTDERPVSKFPVVEKKLLPRPENPVTLGHGINKIFLPGWKGHTAPEEYLQIMAKIKVHVTEEKLRVDEIFQRLDERQLGRIRSDSFKNGLDFLRMSRAKFTDMYLSEKEMDKLCDLYADPTDPERVVWQEFVNDVLDGLSPEELSQWPPVDPNPPSRKPTRLLKRVLPKIIPDLYQDEEGFFAVLGKKVVSRKINLRKGFSEYDVERRGTVGEKMFEIAMMRMGLFFSRLEIGMIRNRYGDDGSINYEKLIGDLEIHSDQSQMDKWFEEEQRKEQAEQEEKNKELLRRESNIVEICAKIKNSLICSKIKTSDLIGSKDPANSGIVSWDVFKACCLEAKLDLSERELDLIRYVFQSNDDAEQIDYPLFSRVVDEPSVVTCLERLPLKKAMQQRREPKAPLEHDFVNFEDRIQISQAMKILCKRITLGHIEMFKELDSQGKGVVNRTQFLQLLYRTGVLHLLSMRQIEALMKGFGHEESNGYVIDYSAWLNALDIVFCTEKAAAKL